MAPPKKELVWYENNGKHTIRLDGGTLSAFYDPINSEYHLSFFPHQILGETAQNGGKPNYGVAVYSDWQMTIHGDAKGILPEKLVKVKDLPQFPKSLSNGLEKIIEKLSARIE